MRAGRSHARIPGMPKAKKGRKPDASSKSGKIRTLLKTGMSPVDIAKKVGCTPALVYNVKARASGKGKSGRRPGRPARAASKLDGLASILDTVRQAEQQRTQLRAALERIQAVIASALH